MTSPAPVIAATALVLAFASAVSAQHSAMPAGMTHEQHMAQMKKDAEMKQHGNVATGFDQADHFGRHFDNAADWVKTFDDPARDAWQMPARVIDALQLAR